MCYGGWLQALQKGQAGQAKRGVALYIMKALDCTVLAVNSNGIESLWIRIKGHENKKNVIVGVCYRPPGHDDHTDELIFRDLQDQLPLFL